MQEHGLSSHFNMATIHCTNAAGSFEGRSGLFPLILHLGHPEVGEVKAMAPTQGTLVDSGF